MDERDRGGISGKITHCLGYLSHGDKVPTEAKGGVQSITAEERQQVENKPGYSSLP